MYALVMVITFKHPTILKAREAKHLLMALITLLLQLRQLNLLWLNSLWITEHSFYSIVSNDSPMFQEHFEWHFLQNKCDLYKGYTRAKILLYIHHVASTARYHGKTNLYTWIIGFLNGCIRSFWPLAQIHVNGLFEW